MNLHLQEISTQVSPGAFAVLTLDGAGWHQLGDRLVVPENIGLLHLPPYSPELNPVENVWEFLRHNDLRVYPRSLIAFTELSDHQPDRRPFQKREPVTI
jgi:transposase